MKTKKYYVQPKMKVVIVETQVIAQSWNSQSVNLLMDLDEREEEGCAD